MGGFNLHCLFNTVDNFLDILKVRLKMKTTVVILRLRGATSARELLQKSVGINSWLLQYQNEINVRMHHADQKSRETVVHSGTKIF